jgi:hypothetical protein
MKPWDETQYCQNKKTKYTHTHTHTHTHTVIKIVNLIKVIILHAWIYYNETPLEGKDLYNEIINHWRNYRRWKDLPCSWTGRINIVKMTILPKSNLHVQCNPHQNSNDIHFRDWKINLKIHLEAQKMQIATAIVSKKSNTEVSQYPTSKYIIAWYWHKNRREDQWKRKDTDMNPCSYTTWFFTKMPQTYDGKKTVFSRNVTEKTGYPHTEN